MHRLSRDVRGSAGNQEAKLQITSTAWHPFFLFTVHKYVCNQAQTTVLMSVKDQILFKMLV